MGLGGGGRGLARTTGRLTCGEPGPGGGQTMEASGGGSRACWGSAEVLITSAGCWETSAGTVPCWKTTGHRAMQRAAPRPPVPGIARGHYRPPGTRLDPLQGAALGSQGCRAPARPPRPRQQWGPAGESSSRGASPASPRACAAAGAALTFPPRHSRGPGPAE